MDERTRVVDRTWKGRFRAEDIRMFGGAPESVEPIEILVLPTSGISFLIRHENSIPKPSKQTMQNGKFELAVSLMCKSPEAVEALGLRVSKMEKLLWPWWRCKVTTKLASSSVQLRVWTRRDC